MVTDAEAKRGAQGLAEAPVPDQIKLIYRREKGAPPAPAYGIDPCAHVVRVEPPEFEALFPEINGRRYIPAHLTQIQDLQTLKVIEVVAVEE